MEVTLTEKSVPESLSRIKSESFLTAMSSPWIRWPSIFWIKISAPLRSFAIRSDEGNIKEKTRNNRKNILLLLFILIY
jgi:hypothetical protein